MKKPKSSKPEGAYAWRIDFAAVVLLSAGVLVALCVFTDEPATSSPTSLASLLIAHQNILGPGGAWIAQVLNETLGVAVYVLLVSWFVLVVLLFLRRGWMTWTFRLAGWLLLLPCMAVLADELNPSLLPAPITGSGGTLGAWLNLWLRESFSDSLRYVVLACCWAVALALTMDFLLRRIGKQRSPAPLSFLHTARQ